MTRTLSTFDGYVRGRLEGWGLRACETLGRTFPRCLHTPGAQFELDQSTVERHE